jgi:hypothetical protein
LPSLFWNLEEKNEINNDKHVVIISRIWNKKQKKRKSFTLITFNKLDTSIPKEPTTAHLFSSECKHGSAVSSTD